MSMNKWFIAVDINCYHPYKKNRGTCVWTKSEPWLQIQHIPAMLFAPNAAPNGSFVAPFWDFGGNPCATGHESNVERLVKQISSFMSVTCRRDLRICGDGNIFQMNQKNVTQWWCAVPFEHPTIPKPESQNNDTSNVYLLVMCLESVSYLVHGTFPNLNVTQ